VTSAFATLASGGPKQDLVVKIERDIDVECRVSEYIAILRPVVFRRVNPGVRLTCFRDDPF